MHSDKTSHIIKRRDRYTLRIAYMAIDSFDLSILVSTRFAMIATTNKVKKAVATAKGFRRCAVTGTLYETCTKQRSTKGSVKKHQNTDVNVSDVSVREPRVSKHDSWATDRVQIRFMNGLAFGFRREGSVDLVFTNKKRPKVRQREH